MVWAGFGVGGGGATRDGRLFGVDAARVDEVGVAVFETKAGVIAEAAFGVLIEVDAIAAVGTIDEVGDDTSPPPPPLL